MNAGPPVGRRRPFGGPTPRFSYLGIDAQPPRAGVHRNQIVSWQVPGKSYSLLGATVRLAAGMHGGTFSGRLLTGGTASGSFACG